jgi:hypothetical protein
VSIERIFHCDGPDCERYFQTRRRRTDHFLVVSEGWTTLHFCGWDCILRHAATKEPEQVIPAGSGSLGGDAD